MRIALSIAAPLIAMLAGCATTAAEIIVDEPLDALPVRLPTPETTAEAQRYLSGSVAAMRAGEPRQAALFLDAILRSDHLTDRGRANIYWLLAESRRLASEEEAHADALGGFLVAAGVIVEDDDIAKRSVEARAMLLARRVKSHALFGKTPDEAIPVEDPREASGVVAELGCGARGDAPWVENGVSSTPAGSRRLEERRLVCSDTGETLTLWFDVTQAR